MLAFDRARLRDLKKLAVYRFLAIPRRAVFGGSYLLSGVPNYLKWIFTSREESNFTYDLTDDNIFYLSHILAVVTGQDSEQASAYIDEVRTDTSLANYLLGEMTKSDFQSVSDKRIGYSRRLGWYAMVRLMKPSVVIETGVDKGLGSVLICAALLRNRAEGHFGKFYGTDIIPTAGWLLRAPYSEVGEILYGDSIESLTAFNEEINLFINDSDHSADYEAREYEVILSKLSKNGVIFGDNCHVTTKLAEFSSRNNRRFLFFKEQPKGHWYPGGGIGISYSRS